jgi:hypothetical protein
MPESVIIVQKVPDLYIRAELYVRNEETTLFDSTDLGSCDAKGRRVPLEERSDSHLDIPIRCLYRTCSAIPDSLKERRRISLDLSNVLIRLERECHHRFVLR